MDNPHAPARDPAPDATGAGSAAEAPAYDYCKYHGLGNDYLVLAPARFCEPVTADIVRAVCDRHTGVGGDGVLLGPLTEPAQRPAGLAPGTVPLRIFNPDGSEAERSGNGLRIFARHLWEHGLVPASPFALHTPAGTVAVRVLAPDGSRVAVAMGAVRFDSAHIPMTGPPREVLREALTVDGETLTVSAANVGNPHCVVPVDDPTPALARHLGPLIEHHASFPQRTNVQFLAAVERHRIRIEIWERGAGYTLASGTSSCAAAAVACRLGLCESPVTVEMPGGRLEITLDADFHAELEGPVQAVSRGCFAPAFLAELGLTRR